MVVAADVGEAKDAAVFAKHLGLPIAIIDKRRSGDEERAEAVAVIGDVRGKRCLLVDPALGRSRHQGSGIGVAPVTW